MPLSCLEQRRRAADAIVPSCRSRVCQPRSGDEGTSLRSRQCRRHSVPVHFSNGREARGPSCATGRGTRSSRKATLASTCSISGLAASKCRRSRGSAKRRSSPSSGQETSSAKAAWPASPSTTGAPSPSSRAPSCRWRSVRWPGCCSDQHGLSDRFISHVLTRHIRMEEDLLDQLFGAGEMRLARTLLRMARYGESDAPAWIVPTHPGGKAG